MTKGFKITIIALSVALAGILAGTIALFVTREKPFLPPAQPALIVVGQEKFLDVDAVSGADGYIFKIDNVEFDSPESTMRVTSIFTEARVYIVEVSVKGKNAKNNSPFSAPVNLVNQLLLPSPLLSFNQSNKLLSWSTSGVEVSYELYANGIVVANNLTVLSYDCSAFVGEFNVYVRALPNNTEYSLPSVKSNTVNLTIFQQLNAPSNLSFDDQTGILTFTPPSNATGIQVMYEVVYNSLSVISLTPVAQGNQMTIDLSPFFEISANPSITIMAMGSGYYSNSTVTELVN